MLLSEAFIYLSSLRRPFGDSLGRRPISLGTLAPLVFPFDPNYLGAARAAIKAIIDEIETIVRGAMRKTCEGHRAEIIPLTGTKNG